MGLGAPQPPSGAKRALERARSARKACLSQPSLTYVAPPSRLILQWLMPHRMNAAQCILKPPLSFLFTEIIISAGFGRQVDTLA
jgi:hypothetical protein